MHHFKLKKGRKTLFRCFAPTFTDALILAFDALKPKMEEQEWIFNNLKVVR